MVENMTKTSVKSRNILLTMKKINQNNMTTIKTSLQYNECSLKITTRSQNKNATIHVVTRARHVRALV